MRASVLHGRARHRCVYKVLVQLCACVEIRLEVVLRLEKTVYDPCKNGKKRATAAARALCAHVQVRCNETCGRVKWNHFQPAASERLRLCAVILYKPAARDGSA